MTDSVGKLTLADLSDDIRPRALTSDTWTNQEIVEAFMRVPVDSVPEAVIHVGFTLVSYLRRICPDTVVKQILETSFIPPPEALAQEFVFCNTSIRTPRISRSFTYEERTYIVMEYIPGRELGKVWDQLSAETQQSVASRLRNYIQELRVASRNDDRSSIPGPLGPTPQRVRGPNWFTMHARGPFNTHEEFIKFSLKAIGGKDFAEKLKKREKLVLTHGDLNMRNILWGDDGQLWVLDWEQAGFYPPFFESFGMIYSNYDGPGLETWRQFIPRITGDDAA